MFTYVLLIAFLVIIILSSGLILIVAHVILSFRFTLFSDLLGIPFVRNYVPINVHDCLHGWMMLNLSFLK